MSREDKEIDWVTVKRIKSSVETKLLFKEQQCRDIEKHLDELSKSAREGELKSNSVERGPLRVKYCFGEGYTCGANNEPSSDQKDKLFPKGEVDPIPDWIQELVIQPIEESGMVEKNWVNCVVINHYYPGGCNMPHIYPQHLFHRPIITASFLSDSAISFGSIFTLKPLKISKPTVQVPVERGCVLSFKDFAADEISHCIRPEDTRESRAVIILHHVPESAPRLSKEELSDLQSEELTRKRNNVDPSPGTKKHGRKSGTNRSPASRKKKVGGRRSHSSSPGGDAYFHHYRTMEDGEVHVRPSRSPSSEVESGKAGRTTKSDSDNDPTDAVDDYLARQEEKRRQHKVRKPSTETPGSPSRERRKGSGGSESGHKEDGEVSSDQVGAEQSEDSEDDHKRRKSGKLGSTWRDVVVDLKAAEDKEMHDQQDRFRRQDFGRRNTDWRRREPVRGKVAEPPKPAPAPPQPAISDSHLEESIFRLAEKRPNNSTVRQLKKELAELLQMANDLDKLLGKGSKDKSSGRKVEESTEVTLKRLKVERKRKTLKEKLDNIRVESLLSDVGSDDDDEDEQQHHHHQQQQHNNGQQQHKYENSDQNNKYKHVRNFRRNQRGDSSEGEDVQIRTRDDHSLAHALKSKMKNKMNTSKSDRLMEKGRKSSRSRSRGRRRSHSRSQGSSRSRKRNRSPSDSRNRKEKHKKSATKDEAEEKRRRAEEIAKERMRRIEELARLERLIALKRKADRKKDVDSPPPQPKKKRSSTSDSSDADSSPSPYRKRPKKETDHHQTDRSKRRIEEERTTKSSRSSLSDLIRKKFDSK